MKSRALGGQAIWSFSGYLFTLAIGLPLQMLIARTVGAEGLGTFNLVEATVALLAALLSFGLAPSVVKFIPNLIDRGQFAAIRRLVYRDAVILGAAGMSVVVLGALLYGEIGRTFYLDRIGYPAFVLATFMVPLSLLLYYYQQVLRGFLAIRQIVFGTSVIQLSVKVVIIIVAFSFGMGVNGLILAAVASASIALFYMVACIHRLIISSDVESGNDWLDFRARHTAFARIQYMMSLFGLMSTHMDRYLLGYFASVSAVGVFGITKMLSQMPGVFLQMLVAASAPLFSLSHARNDLKDAMCMYHLTVDWSVRLSYPIFIYIAVFAHSLLGLFGPAFAEQGEQALYIFIVAGALNASTGPLGIFLSMWGGERAVLRLQVLNQLILLAGFAIGIPLYGLLGAAVAELIAMAVAVIAGYATARDIIKVTWYDARYWRWILPLMGFVGACLFFRESAFFDLTVVNLIVLFIGLNFVFHLSFMLFGLHEDDMILLRTIGEKLAPLMRTLKR